jgi:broad specificity phosphatase PhoE
VGFRDGRATVTGLSWAVSQELGRHDSFECGTHDPVEVPRYVRTLLLVRHAPTSATRAAAFPVDEPLDERGRQQAASLAARLPDRVDVVSSPALRCVETATAAGLDAVIEQRIAACDFGSWAGRTLEEVHAGEPDAAAAWMLDPEACPHGGEALTVFAGRVSGWLDEQAQLSGRVAAVTHGEVVKAALVHALDAPISAFWRIDASPLAITELHAHDGRWTVARVNCLAGAV